MDYVIRYTEAVGNGFGGSVRFSHNLEGALSVIADRVKCEIRHEPLGPKPVVCWAVYRGSELISTVTKESDKVEHRSWKGVPSYIWTAKDGLVEIPT